MSSDDVSNVSSIIDSNDSHKDGIFDEKDEFELAQSLEEFEKNLLDYEKELERQTDALNKMKEMIRNLRHSE